MLQTLIISSWPESIALIGSVVVVCGTIIKIFVSKRDIREDKRADIAEEDTRVLSEKIKQHEKDIDHLHKCVDKLQEDFIKILTGN